MSNTLVQPYLFFDGSCEQAIEFYRTAIGAEVHQLMRYKESPDPCPDGMLAPGSEEKVMHVSFKIGETTVMASDNPGAEKSGFDGFSLSISVSSEDEANRFFTALAEGGSIQMPLGKTFWSPCFGMLTDHFGVSWMISIPA